MKSLAVVDDEGNHSRSAFDEKSADGDRSVAVDGRLLWRGDGISMLE